MHHTLEPSSSSFRCTQCNIRQEKNTRNLVVCIDGTSDEPGHNNTNVVKLFAKIDLESIHPEQFAYYSSGIGTRQEPSHIFGRLQRVVYDKLHMAVVQNTEETIKDAYTWLAQIYREGDRIYLFGFSRGAHQVRELARMIHEVGLIKGTMTEDLIGTAYGHYEAICSSRPTITRAAIEFKKTFSWMDLKVHFIGVWDTVSSVSLIRGDAHLSMSSSADHACHFRHALALDECRVKFMPEYLYEMNSQLGIGKSKYIATSRDIEQAGSANNRCRSTQSDNGADFSESGKKSPDIKEVWFAGSHSDVGGKSSPGEFRNAGHVSLLWMRRESSAHGLVLKPTDIVWLPDDLDAGISNSMTPIWRVMEYLPIKHQVSFSGAGEHAIRLHQLQPRRIIPGQKVHASILYANTYQPRAILGEGFDIPAIYSGLGDMELKGPMWETGLFDDTAARELVISLGSLQGVAPIYLDRLLFMLRFEEGKRDVREVADWQAKFMSVITDRHYPPLVRLVAIVSYHDVSCDHEANPKGCAPPPIELSQDIFHDAKEYLRDILVAHMPQDGPRVITLLRPLTKHQILRERILSPKVMEAVMKFFDTIIERPVRNFGQAMECLDYLLQYEDTRQLLIEKLGARSPNTGVSRLSHILKVDDSHFQAAALRVALTLARIPEARDVCSVVKPRIKKLANKHDRLVGRLAVEILLVLDDWDGEGRTVDPGQQTLSYLFGLDAKELSNPQKKLIGELKKAVQRGNVQERTAATMTLLQLYETTTIRTYLREINMQDAFVGQMRRKDSALLAAYALATCLKHSDMEFVKDNGELPKHIVRMLVLDCFDDAVGQVEGFQVFGDLMQHADLREKIAERDMIHVLEAKLRKGKPKEIRTSLICLDVFRSLDPHSHWTPELVDRSLQNLKSGERNAQKAGVTILYALAQTEHGVAAISPRIHEIFEMLLPAGYLPIRPTRAALSSRTSLGEEEAQVGSTDTFSTTPHDAPPRQPSWMIGPACAIRTLAQNETLRGRMRGMIQYGNVKDLFLSGALVDNKDTPVWRVGTPNRANVINMFYKMITAVDDGPFERGLISLEDTLPPHIRHWSRLVTLLRNRSEAVVTVLSAFLGVPVLVILAAVVYTPIYASARLYSYLRRVVSRYQYRRALHGPRDGEDASGEHGDQSSRVDETTPTQGGGIGEQPTESMETGVGVTHTQGDGGGAQPILHRPVSA